MSETDSFIEEVTEEVRRDKLYGYVRRYGWIAVLLVLLIVGGAAWNEYRKAQTRAAAEALGDGLLAAVASEGIEDRTTALGRLSTDTPGAQTLVALVRGASYAEAGQQETAQTAFEDVAANPDAPEIYRQIAGFKALVLQVGDTPSTELRAQFEALAQPGAPLRLLAEEQLAILDISDGQTTTAIERLQRLLDDAEVTPDLQQRATQVIVALGGTLRASSDEEDG
jgi:hypothetical protein